MVRSTLNRCLLVVLGTCVVLGAAVRQKKLAHLPVTTFPSIEYQDIENDLDEREVGPESPISPMDLPHPKRFNLSYAPLKNLPDKLDPNIVYDPKWASWVEFGQISAVSIDPNGNIGIFHRGKRIWDASTFGQDNKFNINRGPISQNTIILLDKNGNKILEWGMNIFYLPHGLTIDSEGNYWITDVAMHQVFKFDGKDIKNHQQQFNRQSHSQRISMSGTVDINNLFANSIIKPSIILGEAFQPGNDNIRFCKPTAVAVQKNGDFFVSDGYCNSRIIKFNRNGERIMQWGRTWNFDEKAFYQNAPPQNAFLVPHALALAEEHDYIFIADRENARIVCSFANNGTIHKEYKNPIFGAAIYSIAYANNKLYLVNGNKFIENTHIRGFILDIDTGEILSQFAPYPEDMDKPHDIAVTSDEKEIYVVELSSHRIYRFDQDIKLQSKLNQTKTVSDIHHISKKPSQRALILVVIVAALFFIGFCIFLAAVLARYQKRGRKTLFEEPRVEFTKLVEQA